MSELAGYLKSERLRQGLSLKTVSEKTMLSVNALQALEDGDFGRIGAPLLIRSFISSYCSALEIESGPVLEKYAAEIKARNWQEEGIQRYGGQSKSFQKTKRGRVYSLLLIGLALGAALYGGVLISIRQEKLSESQTVKKEGYPQQELPSDLSPRPVPPKMPEDKAHVAVRPHQETPPAAKVKTEEPKASAPVPQPLPPQPAPKSEVSASVEVSRPKPPVENTPPEPVMAAQTTPPADSDGRKHRLTFTASQETWVQVKPDNGKPRGVLLKPGDSREWEISETAAVLVGNAGGVQATWDGKAVSLPGKSGTVIKLRLPDPRYLKE